MLFTPLRKALIAGTGIFAVGVAAGVTVHSATVGTTLTASTATPSPSASPNGPDVCRPRPAALGAAEQVLSIAATTLGQTQQQILDQLRSGKTLDQVAGSKASAIEQQSLDKLKTLLDKRVSNGKLSSSQESTMLANAKTALEKAMSSDLSSKIPTPGMCSPGRLLRTLIKVTADKTGMTVQQVMDALKSGKSIDQIAGDKAADIKATVLQMQQQKASSDLDTLMGRAGLQGPAAGGAGPRGGRPGFGIFGRGGGPKHPGASPSPSA